MPRLEVRVCGARNLKNTEFFGTIDPYATIEFEGLQYKTAVADNTTNPEWNEVFKFNCRDENTSQLVIKIFNSDTVSDEFLGEYSLSINGLTRGEVSDTWVLLRNCKGNAELHIRCCAVDFGDLPDGAQQQAPSQGYQAPPPQGYPPQGPPQGYPPQGYSPQGYPPQGYPPQGYPPQGPPQGYPPQGPPQGYPPQGYQAAPPPQCYATQGPQFTYTSAWYGTDQQPSYNGVLEKLSACRRGPGNVYVPANMNGTLGYDPAPGVLKVTCVTGTLNGVEVVVRVTEGTEYSFNFTSQPTGMSFAVVDAWYGTRGQMESRNGVLPKVQAMMRGPGMLAIPSNKNAVFGDPVPGVLKTLFVRLVTADRTSIDLYVSEPTEFTFCA